MNFWDSSRHDIDAQMGFFQWAAGQLEISSPDRWRTISMEQLHRLDSNMGSMMISKYGIKELWNLLKRLYFEYDWDQNSYELSRDNDLDFYMVATNFDAIKIFEVCIDVILILMRLILD
jgi:hypothetical protein